MKYLSWFTSAAVLIVAAAAFVLAFFNVEGLAIDNGVPVARAWLVPVIVEGAMLALAFTRLEAEVNRRDTRLLTWLIGAAVVLSVALNWAHSNMELWGIVIAVIQPVSLLVAFEAFMYQLRYRIAARQQSAVNPWRIRARKLIDYARCLQKNMSALQDEAGRLQTAVNDLQGQNTKLLESNKQLQLLNKRWQALGIEAQAIVRLNAGEINETQAVDATGWDVRTVRAWSEKLNGVAK